MPAISEIYSFNALEEKINTAVSELLSESDDLKAKCREYAVRENEYRRAKSVAYLNAEGTIPERAAKVDQVCEQQRLAAHIAEAEKEASVERIKSLRAALSAYQTLARVNQSEMEMAGQPQPRWGIQ